MKRNGNRVVDPKDYAPPQTNEQEERQKSTESSEVNAPGGKDENGRKFPP